MHFLTGWHWQKGKGNENNQDSIILHQVVTEKGKYLMAAVCDGIGGLDCGQAASGYVTEELIQWFYTEALVLKRKRKKAVIRAVIRKLYQLHEEFVQYAKQEQIQLGTTLTMLLVMRKRYFIIHTGDSRCYQWNRTWLGRWKGIQLTQDHVQRGKLSKGIGSFSWQKPDYITGTCRKQTAFLLCTDGFRHMIESIRIEQTLCPQNLEREEQIERRLQEIAERSIKKGEQDDISAVYIKLEKGKQNVSKV